jgi:hypothetical protein
MSSAPLLGRRKQARQTLHAIAGHPQKNSNKILKLVPTLKDHFQRNTIPTKVLILNIKFPPPRLNLSHTIYITRMTHYPKRVKILLNP